MLDTFHLSQRMDAIIRRNDEIDELHLCVACKLTRHAAAGTSQARAGDGADATDSQPMDAVADASWSADHWPSHRNARGV